MQQRQNLDAVGCRTIFSGLLSMFVFDILQIPDECIQICSGCKALPPGCGAACSGRVVLLRHRMEFDEKFCLLPKKELPVPIG
jgi:hypothetical protein